jgi:DNA-binding HxlR family transcriptional regulator
MATTERTYGQWCPIAVGLDLIGDRWVLLICRELMLGDQRFTDLRTALPGLAPNLLTDRLRSLGSAGMITTAELPPPAARTVYRLTEYGRTVGPVLRALARFGAQHLEGEPSTAMAARLVANALLVPWRQRIDTHLRVRLMVDPSPTTDADAIDIELDGLATRLTPADGEADVTILATPGALAVARRTGGAGAGVEYRGKKAHVAVARKVFALY